MDDIKRFKQRLIDKENPPDKIADAIKLLSDYYNFLQTKNKNFNSISSEDFYEFSKKLIKQERNTGFSYEVFIIFGQFIENQELIKLGREVLDGSEVMSNLSKRLIEEYGQDFLII